MARIVVVDNDSGDGSFQRLSDTFREPAFNGQVSVLESRHNGGYGFGINVGVRHALAWDPPPRYLYVLNPDALPDPGSIRELVAFADARPDAGMVGNLVYSPAGENVKAFRFPSILSEFESTARIGILTRLLRSHRIVFDPGGSREVDWCRARAC